MKEQSGFDLQEHVVRAAVCPCSWCVITQPLTKRPHMALKPSEAVFIYVFRNAELIDWFVATIGFILYLLDI